jgi:hypothetical protein
MLPEIVAADGEVCGQQVVYIFRITFSLAILTVLL